MSSREMRSGKREREKEKVSEVRVKEKERSRAKEELKPGEASPRPKRLAVQKGLEYSHGLLWKEETDLKKALYMSLQESKKINLGISHDASINSALDKDRLGSTKKKLKNSLKTDDENHEIGLKNRTKVHAQRKFAQGSHPNSPVTTPVKFKSTSTNLIPSRRPKTEDFLTFLCLRGTSALPPSLDFFNFASRSNVQAVSDSRCQTPVTPDLSNQSSPFTRDHSNRASPVYWEHSNGALNSLPEKNVKKTSDSKNEDFHEKKDILNRPEIKDYVENKKREKSDLSRKNEIISNHELLKPEKENHEAVKRYESRDKLDNKKKSECKATLDYKSNLERKSFNQENSKSPKKKLLEHRETRSEKYQQENKESPLKKTKDLKKHTNHDSQIKDENKKDFRDFNKIKMENKDKEILKKTDNKEKRSSLKNSLKKSRNKDINIRKSEKYVIKNREMKHSFRKIDYREILKKMEHLKSKTRAGQKKERKELLEKQEKLKKRKEEKLREKKEAHDKTKDKKENIEKLKEKEFQDKLKETKIIQEKMKETKENHEKSKEKKELQDKFKDKREITEKLKDKRYSQDKIKEKRETLEKMKEKREIQEKIKEKKDSQERFKDKKDTQEKMKDKKDVEKIKDKRESSDKIKKDFDKRESLEKTKISSYLDGKESLERFKSIPDKKDNSEKSKGLFQLEKKNINSDKKLPIFAEKTEMLEKTRSATQIEKKEQEKVKIAIAANEKKELEKSKNTFEKKEIQEKNKAISHLERKEIDRCKFVIQEEGFTFKKDEMRDRSMDPIVVVKAKDTVGHRLDGGNKSQSLGIVAPIAIHVTPHRESTRILDQSLPYLPKIPTPLLSLLPVPSPITSVNKLKLPSSGTNNLLIKKASKLSVKKTVLSSSPIIDKPVEMNGNEKKDNKGENKQRFMRKRKLSEGSDEKPLKKKNSNKIMPISNSLTQTPTSSMSSPVPILPKDFLPLSFLKSQEPVTPIKTPLKPPRHSKASSLAISPLRMPLPGSPDVSPPSKRRGRPPGTGKKQKLDSSLIPLEPFPSLDASAKMVDAPIYRPSEEEFNDPFVYIEKIREEAEKYGICCIIPPSSWKPDCKVSDDMRINSSIQYVHKMLYRWGPNVQHVECMRKHLETQGVTLGQAPLIGGVELDISRLYQTIHHFGGMQQVNDKKKWNKVADTLHIPKGAHDRVSKLYDAYCKYLVSYDTLSKEDQQKLDQQVTAERQKKRYRASDPNLNCVVKGRLLSLSSFYRVARNILSTWFKQEPTHQEAEHEFWRIVTERLIHTAVHSGNLDTKICGSGFPSHKASPFSKHGWNLNVLAHNGTNILRFLGSLHITGITAPILHVGMLYTASCWYRDPHFLPKIEYLHTGADKIWYCIPESHGEVFHQAMKTAVPEYCVKTPIWLPTETIMVPPFMLVANGVSLCRLVQQAGQFVVVFSQAYTASICCGYNISESLILAKSDWLNKCPLAFKNLKESCEPPLFSFERLLFAFVNDHRTHIDILQKIFPMLEEIRDAELKLRKQLFDIGLKTAVKIGRNDESENKSRRSKNFDEDGECEVCRCFCYLSMVVNELEESVYCLQHAINLLQKRKNFKNWKLLYRFDQSEINNDLMTVQLRLASATTSPKKKTAPKSPKT